MAKTSGALEILSLGWTLALCVCSFLLSGQSLEKVDPPFWWAGMQNSHLQLLLHDKEISELDVVIKDSSVKIIEVRKADSPNYLFVDLDLSKAAAGSFEIQLKKKRKIIHKFDYELKKRDPNSRNRKGLTTADAVYLITPDRFANGDTSNDEIDGLREGLNREAEYGRHGGDLKGISSHLEYIKDVGFTAIWLNPVLINDQDEWSYHGYGTTDYYAVDPRFGTNEEYVALSKKAKEMGVGMVMDIIVNHCGSFHWWMKDPPFSDWFNNQDKPYAETNHRKETLLDPYGAEGDRKKMVEGWFVPAMPDLNQRNKFMSTYLIQNSIWWIEYADLTAIRQDTYSYPFREFMTAWTCAIMNEYPDFYIVGEEWIDDTSVISYWQRDKVNADGFTSCLPGLMDFPLCFDITKALTEEEGWDTGLIRLYQRLAKDYLYADPSKLIVFPDNHDMKRTFVQLGRDFDKFKMAMTFLMTTRGIPQLYYGTEILMDTGEDGSHGLIRSDFPGGWPDDSISVKDGVGLSEEQQAGLDFVSKLLNWRKNNKVIHKGKLLHYIPEEGVYVYFRIQDGNRVMVVLNKNEEEYQLDLTRFEEVMNGVNSAALPMTGEMLILEDIFTLSPMQSYILELK